MLITLKLKHKVVRNVNIGNIVLFTKTSFEWTMHISPQNCVWTIWQKRKKTPSCLRIIVRTFNNFGWLAHFYAKSNREIDNWRAAEIRANHSVVLWYFVTQLRAILNGIECDTVTLNPIYSLLCSYGIRANEGCGQRVSYSIVLLCLGFYSMLFMSEIIELSAPRIKCNMISKINCKVSKTVKCYTDHIQEKD